AAGGWFLARAARRRSAAATFGEEPRRSFAHQPRLRLARRDLHAELVRARPTGTSLDPHRHLFARSQFGQRLADDLAGDNFALSPFEGDRFDAFAELHYDLDLASGLAAAVHHLDFVGCQFARRQWSRRIVDDEF